MDGTDRDPTIERRLDQLEARIAMLEAGAATARSVPGAAVSPTQTTWTVAAEPRRAAPPPAPVSALPTGWVVPPAIPAPGPQGSIPSVGPTGWVTPGRAPAPVTPAPSTTWASVPDAGPSVDLRAVLADLEERMTGRMLVWVGGIALVLAAILFLGLAFSQGWIGPELRVLMGLAAGTAGIAVGAFFMERGNGLLGHVLTPVGLAVISISLFAATRLYGLIPVPLGLVLALVAAIVTAIIAIRADSQAVAAFGLVAVLIAPPLLGATPDLATLAFVGVALVGTTTIALWRSWPWLPPLAFILTAPQMASWLVGETNVAFGLVGLAAFSAVQAVAAGGEEFRRRRDDLSASSTTLLIASSAFLVWGGFQLLDGDLVAYRATFLVIVALAYLGLGTAFLLRDGDRHLFGLVTMATGLAGLTMAAPIGLGAPAVPVAWTAEAVALAWVAIRRPHPYSALVAGLLYGLTAAWLVGLVFVPGTLPAASVPFAHGGGVALAVGLVGIALGIAIVPILSARRALAALGLATAAWCAAVELSGGLVVDAQIWLAVAGAALVVGLPLIATRTVDWRPDGLIARAWPALEAFGPLTRPLVPAVAVATGAVATGHLLAYELYADWVAPTTGVPFVSVTGLTLAVYLLGLLAVGWLIRSWPLRQSLVALGLLVVAVACSDELWGVPLVAALSALTVLGLGLGRILKAASERDAAAATAAPPSPATWTWTVQAVAGEAPRVAALLVGALAAIFTVRTALPIDSLGGTTLPAVPFTDEGTAMVVILAVAAVISGLVVGGPDARRIGVLAAGVAVAYLIPFEVEPWAVVVLWSIMAIAAFVATRLEPDGTFLYEPAGLAMLAIAVLAAIGRVAPPSRLVISADGLSQLVALETLVALAALGVAGAIGAVLLRAERWARWLELGVGLEVVYLVSIAVVDIFAIQVGGATPLEELRWQSQAALSVAWAVLGMIAFVAGLRLERAELRVGGLVLLGLTTVKVFVIDLAALDVAYKVLALFGLGLVLVVSGGLWQRLHIRPPRTPHGPAAVHP